MLTIETKKGKPQTWHLGSEDVFPSPKLDEIVSVQADEAELALILDQFDGIPRTKEHSQVWVGPFAAQIMANLNGVVASAQRRGKGRRQKGGAAGTAPME